MEKKSLFAGLYDLFSSNVVVRNIGGKKLKVVDTSRQQASGNPYLKTNRTTNSNRYRRGRKYLGSGYTNTANSIFREQRNELYSDYEVMDEDGIIASALDIYSDESTTKHSDGSVLRIDTENLKIKEILENLFNDILNIEYNIWGWVRNLCKYGDFFLYLDIKENLGVVNVLPLSSYDMERVDGQDEENPYQTYFVYEGERGTDIMDNFQVAHFRLIGDTNFLPYGKCLTADSYVDTEFGRKPISEISTNDNVFSYNIKTKKYELTKVLATKSSGTKKVYNIKTTNNELKGSENHPFLIYNDGELSYKNISELVVNDIVVLQDINKKSVEYKINKILDGGNKNGWKNNINNIPDIADSEFVRFFGFMLGDGWVSKDKMSVSFAQGVDDNMNKYYGEILRKYSGKDLRYYGEELSTDNILKEVKVNSKLLAQILYNNGWIDGCHNKRIPQWVFTLSEDLKLEFVRGLVDADGSINVDEWGVNRYQVELCNYMLVKDLQQLLDTMHIKTSHINQRRSGRKLEICGNKTKSSGSYYFYFYLDGNRKTQLKKYRDVDINNIRLEPIRKIEYVGEEETYDIQVKDNNNFFANGFLVHNSMIENARKVFKQLHLMEDAMMIHRITRAPEKRAYYIDVGNLSPNEVDRHIENIMNEMKKTPVVDPQTGNYNLDYNVQNMLEDFYFPVRGDKSGTRIESLPGLSYEAIDDIDYLKSKMFAALKVPKSFLTYDEGMDGKAVLAQQDIRFARTIERIQKVIVSELYKIAVVHLYSQGFRDEEIVNFTLELNNPSIVFEREKMDLLEAQVRLARDMKDLNMLSMEKIYRDIFKLSEKEIEEEKKKVIEDQKTKFRHEQIAMEGNDPVKTNESYGTKGDMMRLQYKMAKMNNMGFEEEMPDGGWEGSGRPKKVTQYGTDDDVFGRDPIGRKAVKQSVTPSSSSPKQSKKKPKLTNISTEVSNMMMDEDQKKELLSEYKKAKGNSLQKTFENVSDDKGDGTEGTYMDDKNIKD